LYDAHRDYRAAFEAVTRRAGHRFEGRMWREVRADADERIDLYSEAVSSAVERLKRLLAERGVDRIVWASLKAVFSALHMDDPGREVAETFFNSVTRRVFGNVGVDPDIEFVHGDAAVLPAAAGSLVSAWPGTVRDQVEALLRSMPCAGSMGDLDGNAAAVAARVVEEYGPDSRIEAIRVPFHREQGAYVVARVRGGDRSGPLVVCLRHPVGGIVVDAVVTDQDAVSVMFGFTRSHFHIAAGPPAEIVRFLRTILPRKRVAELYVAIGEPKHGKTELYRDLVDHLSATRGKFTLAPGTEGLVMVVFTLDGFDMVFKVIRDRAAPPKMTTRSRVMDRYRFVYRNDRAGRLVEAHEFEHLRIPADRLDPDLVRELCAEAARTVHLEGDDVVIDHVYMERRVDPLDIALAAGRAGAEAVRDYGRTIEELALTGVFCGDILPKNFGLTRTGRVVFYDYDEIDSVTGPVFRVIPTASDPLDEMSAEPWFGYGPDDAFPQEWLPLLGLRPEHREVLGLEFSHLFDPDFWRDAQQAARSGAEPYEVMPYPPTARL
jgi:isocitrate dehydrogenase kinase/phosphatase